MKREEEICTDETVNRLESQLKALTSRPDSRRRWTWRVIERLRVTERAAELLLERHLPPIDADEEWFGLVGQAIRELRKEGTIRPAEGMDE
jgi:hypothetical protein